LLAECLTADQARRTTVVFDAQRLPAGESQIVSRRKGMQVMFSVGYEDADTMIEELIAGHSHPKKLLVVSSDHRIQTAANRRRARAIDSDVWWDQIENASQANPSTSQTQPAKEIQDSHDWQAEFEVDSPEASQALIREIENEMGLEGNSKQTENVEDIEQQFKDIDWMREFGFEEE
jgi:predicted RNA-binding protein with PIN domain